MDDSPSPQVFIQILRKGAEVSVRKHPDDAGFDLYSLENYTLKAGESVKIPLGLAFMIPFGYYGQIKPRSGFASEGITTDGGVIDAGYRGEVSVILYNRNREEGIYKIRAGERFAQLIILPIYVGSLVVVDKLPGTERGEGGFGSTGRSDETKHSQGVKHGRIRKATSTGHKSGKCRVILKRNSRK